MNNNLKLIGIGSTIVLIVATALLLINPPRKTSEPIQTPMEKVVIIEKVEWYFAVYKVKRINEGVVKTIRVKGIEKKAYIPGDTIYWRFE